MGAHVAWPVYTDVTNKLVMAGFDSSASNYPSQASIEIVLDGVVATIRQKTKRDFLVTTATRYFNGSGNSELYIDEYTDITYVGARNAYSPETYIEYSSYIEASTNAYPRTLISLNTSANIVQYPFARIFPEGIRNIKITGSWGYSVYIPDDLWEVCALEAACTIGNALSLDGGRQAKKWTEIASEEYHSSKFSESTGWHKRFVEVVESYTRPYSSIKKRQGRVML